MAVGKSYSASEIQTMQQDAIRRVREMQSRSQNYVKSAPHNDGGHADAPEKQKKPAENVQSGFIPNGNYRRAPNGNSMPNGNTQERSAGNPFGQQNGFRAEKPPPEREKPPPEKEPQKKPGLNLLNGIIPDIKIDEEKALIIFILIILARNGGDIKLLIALGYLLM